MFYYSNDNAMQVKRIPALRLIISLTWLFGFTSSIFVATSIISQPSSAVMSRESFISLIAVLTFPLLLSTLLITLNKVVLIIPFVFIKAFSFGFVGSAFTVIYGTAAWLIRSFVLLSTFCNAATFLLYLLRNCYSKRTKLYSDCIVYILVNFIIGIMDYYIISPSLFNLLY